jgi:hypothetical protein
MKRLVKFTGIIGATAVILLASRPVEVLAAAADPVTLSKLVKIYKGDARAPGGKVLATDGSNFYSAYLVKGGTTDSIMLTRIANNGTAAGAPTTILTRAAGALDGQVSVAVGNSPSAPDQKIIHLVWSQQAADTASGTSAGIYYSRSEDAGLQAWAPPVKVNDKVPNWGAMSIAPTRSGVIHILFFGDGSKAFHTTAPTPGAPFTKPVQIATDVKEGDRNIDTALDSGDNLHLAFVAAADGTDRVGVRYMKRLATDNKWSEPVDVIPLTPTTAIGYLAIAAADANAVYIASTVVNESKLEIYRSSNGGKTWTAKVLAVARPSAHVSITLGNNKAVTAGVGAINAKTGLEDALIFRSMDGQTWGFATTIPKQTSVNIAVDNSNKVGVLTEGVSGADEGVNFFSKEL